jgi:hypothetical protein
MKTHEKRQSRYSVSWPRFKSVKWNIEGILYARKTLGLKLNAVN